MGRKIVIVGAGLAGATAATELREQGYAGPVVLLGAEEHPPYERPPLSKAYLLGDDPFEKALVHPAEWYAEHDVDLRLGATATGLPEITELDINPLIVHAQGEGCSVADARMVLQRMPL